MILDKLDKLRPRERLFLALGLFFVFALLCDRLVATPLIKKLGELDQNIAIEQKSLEFNREVMSHLDAVLVLEEVAKLSPALAFPIFESCFGPILAIAHFADEVSG